jgi:hypothetical protein
MAGRLWRSVSSAHSGGASKYRKVIFIETDFFP